MLYCILTYTLKKIKVIPMEICSKLLFAINFSFGCPEQIPSISTPEMYPRKSPERLFPVINTGRYPPISIGSKTQ